MNQIDKNPFNQTPVAIGNRVFGMLAAVFCKWFDQIEQALLRPTITLSVAFPLTASGSSSDFVVNFPKGSVSNTDFPVLQSPVPPHVGTCFTVHIPPLTQDQVWIRFNNYSGAPLAVPLPQPFGITVLKN